MEEIKILSGLFGVILIVDDILEHTVGSPITGRKTKFDPKQVHHAYFGILLLWYAFQK
jgi:hypothetical protein